MPGLGWEQILHNTNSFGDSKALAFISSHWQHHPGLPESLRGPKFPSYPCHPYPAWHIPYGYRPDLTCWKGRMEGEIKQTLRRLTQSGKIMSAPASAGNRCANFPAQRCQCSSLLTATHLLAESCAAPCQGCPPHRLPVTARLRNNPCGGGESNNPIRSTFARKEPNSDL